MLRLIRSSLSSAVDGDEGILEVKPLNAVERKPKREAVEADVGELVFGVFEGSEAGAWLGVWFFVGVISGQVSMSALSGQDGRELLLLLSPVKTILLL